MKRKIIPIILVLLFVCSMLTGCGASDALSGKAEYDNGFTSDAITGSGSIEENYYTESTSDSEPGESIGSSDIVVEDQEDSATEKYLNSQKLIYFCDIEIETLNFSETIKTIKNLIEKYDGFIESDSLSDSSWRWYYSDYEKSNGTLSEYIVIRIPTQSYTDFLDELDGSGKIMSKSERVTNITKTYNDTATTIEVLEKEESMLLDMMDKCETIPDMIAVEDRLSEIQQELAILRSNLSSMDVDIAYSTISVNINEVMEYTYTVEELTFIQRVANAIKNSGSSFVEVLSSLVIALIFMFPYIIIVLVLTIIVIHIVKKKKNKKTAQAETSNITSSIKENNNTEEK